MKLAKVMKFHVKENERLLFLGGKNRATDKSYMLYFVGNIVYTLKMMVLTI